MWKLHRYYLKEVTITLALTFTVLFGIMLVASLSRGIDGAQGGDLLSAALIAILWAADTFPHLLTISLLAAIVLTFARASADREITAIRAAGISPRVPMVAALLLGLVSSIGGSYIQHYLLPKAHYNKYRVTGEALRNFVLNTGMTGNQIAFKGFFLSAGRKDSNGHLHEVVIKLSKDLLSGDHPVGLPPGRAFWADEAWVDISADGETLRLILRDISDPAGTNDLPGDFELRMNIRSLTGRERQENDDDLTSVQLLTEVRRGMHEDPLFAEYTVHKRGCFALMPFLFAPIGFCLGVWSQNRGRMMALLLSIVPVVIYYICAVAASSALRPLGCAAIGWLPALVISLLGGPFCWRLLRR